MKLKIKYKIPILMFMLTFVLMLLAVPAKTYAYVGDGETTFSEPSIINIDASELGLSNVEIDSDQLFGDSTTITMNGFDYTIDTSTSSPTLTVSFNENVATEETIFITNTIGEYRLSNTSVFNSLDFSKFESAKNIVFDFSLNIYTAQRIMELPTIENVYILNKSIIPLIPANVKNVFLLDFKAGIPDTWDKSTYLDVAEFGDETKFITIDTLKYIEYGYLRTYLDHTNYDGTENLDLHVIDDSELPQDVYNLIDIEEGTNVQVSGAQYVSARTNVSIHNRKAITYVDPIVTKLVVDKDVDENFSGFFNTIPNNFKQVFFEGEATDYSYSKVKGDVLICPIPEVFTYSNYTGFDEVYFYAANDLSTITLTDDSLADGEEADVQFYFTSDITVTNSASSETLFINFSLVDEIPEAQFEVEYKGVTKSYNDITKSIDEIKREIDASLSNSGNNNSQTPGTGNENNNNQTPGTDDENNNQNNDNNDSNTDGSNDENKDDNSDVKEELKDKVDEFVDTFKEKFEDNKAVKAVTIVISVTFGIGFIYLVYVVIKKISKLFKSR